jgi:hypothetical protein
MLKKLFPMLLLVTPNLLFGQITFKEILLPTPISQAPIDGDDPNSINSKVWADVNDDNNLDFLYIGEVLGGDSPVARLYINDGYGNLSVKPSTPFEGVYYSSIAFADIDNDNDLDVLVSGINKSTISTTLYTNDGLGNFTKVEGTPFTGMTLGSISFADVDNDNDLDVLISGADSNSQRIAKLYLNDGAGNFSEVENTPFDGVILGSLVFADVDNDDDLDVLITGSRSEGDSPLLYENDGEGSFTKIENTPFEGVTSPLAVFADLNNNNLLDLVISGKKGNNNYITTLYENNGDGEFSVIENTNLRAFNNPSIELVDINEDNLLDLLISGTNKDAQLVTSLYQNITTTCAATLSVDKEELPTLNGKCSIDAPKAPTATASCEGTITGISDIEFPIIDTDIKEIIWTFTDSKGNKITQTQAVEFTELTVEVNVNDSELSTNIENATYQWLDCENNFSVIEGATTKTFEPSTDGSYAVEVSKDGCNTISECKSMTVLGVIENTFNGNIEFFPNPTEGKVNINLNQKYNNLQLKVQDATGKVVEEMQFTNKDDIILDLQQPQGLYLITLTNGKETATLRLIKK